MDNFSNLLVTKFDFSFNKLQIAKRWWTSFFKIHLPILEDQKIVNLHRKPFAFWAVAMAEWSIPITEDMGSNSAIGNVLVSIFIYYVENKKRKTGFNGPIKD